MTGRPRLPLEPAVAALLIAAGDRVPRIRLAVALNVSETVIRRWQAELRLARRRKARAA